MQAFRVMRKAEATRVSTRVRLGSNSNGLIAIARLPNRPDAAAVGANPERVLAQPVGLSVAWRTSSSLASALQLDQTTTLYGRMERVSSEAFGPALAVGLGRPAAVTNS
jgi:hypothetical protein